MGRTCCVIGCNVRSHDRSNKKIENGLSFHIFPAWKQREGAKMSELTKRRRMAWISAVRRPDITFSNISRYLRVCSRHFHSGKPSYEMDELNPDWVPTLNMGHCEVWLAALRETDKDPSEQHFICEDHFLPEDISGNDVRSDAIPIMPPYLDGPHFPTGADPLLEEEQWATGGRGEEEEEDEDEAPEQNPNRPAQNPSEPDVKSESCPQDETTDWFIREGTPVTRLTRGFLQLLMVDPDAWLDVREAAEKLQTHRHRVQSVVDVLQGVGLVQSDSDERVRWTGSSPIFSFLWRDTLSFLTMLQGLKDMEEEVDRLFKSCSQQLFDLTEDEENSSLAYIRCDDIRRLGALKQQTVIVIRSPPETKLVIPPPDEDGIRMQLKSENGPIMALTCDMGTLTSELTTSSSAFSALESRVRACTIDEVVNKKMKI